MTSGPRSPAELADAAYEALRELNHATVPAECALDDHQDLTRVLASLAALLRITPQALRQAADWTAREYQAGRIRVDAACPTSPATRVGAMVAALTEAASRAAKAARGVNDAHQAAAHLIVEQPNASGM